MARNLGGRGTGACRRTVPSGRRGAWSHARWAASRTAVPPARTASIVSGTTPARSTTSSPTTAPTRAGLASLNVTRRIALPSEPALARREIDVGQRPPRHLARLGRGQADQPEHGGGQLGVG